MSTPAGISMTGGLDKHVSSRSPTTDDVRSLDELQSELHEGPCVTAALQPPDDGIIVARDLAEDPDASYWPRFAPRAVTLGSRSMMSTHLSANGPRRAALNLYSRKPGVFDPSARTVAPDGPTGGPGRRRSGAGGRGVVPRRRTTQRPGRTSGPIQVAEGASPARPMGGAGCSW